MSDTKWLGSPFKSDVLSQISVDTYKTNLSERKSDLETKLVSSVWPGS